MEIVNNIFFLLKKRLLGIYKYLIYVPILYLFSLHNQQIHFFFQAQRDYFGAHTYELLNEPGKFVHTNWTGLGGQVSASTYDA